MHASVCVCVCACVFGCMCATCACVCLSICARVFEDDSELRTFGTIKHSSNVGVQCWCMGSEANIGWNWGILNYS